MRRLSLCALMIPAALIVCATPASAAETSGSVMAVNVEKNELVVADVHGRLWTFSVSKSARVVINNRPGRLAELGAGDTVRVIHEPSDKRLLATEINAMQM